MQQVVKMRKMGSNRIFGIPKEIAETVEGQRIWFVSLGADGEITYRPVREV